MSVYPVIMCGGSGTRLWPASRPSRPKQFIPLIGDQSLFLQTAERLAGITGHCGLIVVAGAAHGRAISQALKGWRDVTVLLEPEGRDSAPAIAAAAAWIRDRDPQGIAAVVASDHFIPDPDAFRRAIETAAQTAREGRIVTLGIVPTEPNSAYGYIRPAVNQTSDQASNTVYPVEAFVEKPDLETARTYIAKGYLWNSGNFVFAAETMHAELADFQPDILAAASQAVTDAHEDSLGFHLADVFRSAPKISIDYAIMEKTARASVLPTALEWSDLGAWNSVYDISPRDESGNSKTGAVYTENTEGCLLRAGLGLAVGTVGVKNMAVIAERDAVLVCSLDQAQNVKAIVQQLKDTHSPQADISSGDDQSLDDLAVFYRCWLETAALPLWATLGCDHAGWGFHESLTQAGTPTGADRRARVQARQIYVFAEAGSRNWQGPWQSCVRHGLDGLEHYYLAPDGLIRALVTPEGHALDENQVLYDQAFAILAFARASSIEPDAEEKALRIVDVIEAKLAHPSSGFRENQDEAFQSNPHMHLFEAALAWLEADSAEHKRWRALADQIIELCLDRFIDPAGSFLREFFDADWRPAPGKAGTVVEPGHQFEWAWLIARYGRLTNNTHCLDKALGLYAAGSKGVDPVRQVTVDTLNDRLVPVTDRARLWPQTERLKAALILSEMTDDPHAGLFRGDARAAALALKRYLDTPVNGLWWDKMTANGSFENEPASASSFYHIIAAIVQLDDTVGKLS